jgi:hypothetical protein
VNSVNSLFTTVHGLATDHVDVRRMAALNLDLMVDLVERGLAARAKAPAERIVDVRYGDLVADPIGTVRSTSASACPSPTRSRPRSRLADHRPKEKFGRHDYAAEDFGMTDAQITERFKGYTARFLE